MTQQIDSVCDLCNRIADWRIRDRDGNIRAAACRQHQNERRTSFYEMWCADHPLTKHMDDKPEPENY